MSKTREERKRARYQTALVVSIILWVAVLVAAITVKAV